MSIPSSGAPTSPTAPPAKVAKPGRRPNPRIAQWKRTWYFLRRNTLALVGLGIIIALVGMALYAATTSLNYYSLQEYCATSYTNPTSFTQAGPTIQLSPNQANGTYTWSIASLTPGYVGSPSNGTFTVNGANLTYNVTFVQRSGGAARDSTGVSASELVLASGSSQTYRVVFQEKGLPAGSSWTLTAGINSANQCTPGLPQVCTYHQGSVPPGPGCYQVPCTSTTVCYLSVIAPTISLNPPTAGPLPMGALTLQPGTQYYFNTFQGILRGSDWSLMIAVSIVAGGAMIGLFVGAISGAFGGVVDEAIMRLVDIFLSIPQILFVIIVIAAITSHQGTVLGLSAPDTPIFLLIVGFLVTWWPFYARVVRGQVLVVREQKYVEAARASGASRGRIIRRHIIPNSMYPIFIQMSLDVGSIPLLIGALVFLGFKLFESPFFPEWGSVSALSVTDLKGFLTTCQVGACVVPWWQFLFPGLVLFLFAISVNFLSDGLRDALDPRLRR